MGTSTTSQPRDRAERARIVAGATAPTTISRTDAAITPGPETLPGSGSATSLSDARALFLGTLASRAERTRRTYATALDRLGDFLAERGFRPNTATQSLPVDLLEGFYLWCVRRYGTA